MFTIIASSFLAGIAISLGAIVNLVVGPPLGPFLFAVGLFMVIALRFDLFTGKAGLNSFYLEEFKTVWIFPETQLPQTDFKKYYFYRHPNNNQYFCKRTFKKLLDLDVVVCGFGRINDYFFLPQ